MNVEFDVWGLLWLWGSNWLTFPNFEWGLNMKQEAGAQCKLTIFWLRSSPGQCQLLSRGTLKTNLIHVAAHSIGFGQHQSVCKCFHQWIISDILNQWSLRTQEERKSHKSKSRIGSNWAIIDRPEQGFSSDQSGKISSNKNNFSEGKVWWR